MNRPVAIAILVLALGAGACKRTRAPEAGGSATAMGSWEAWQTLEPLLEVVRTHGDATAVGALTAAAAELKKGKIRAADRRLVAAANSSARHFVAVARADLAAMYFTHCIRGVAWRLPETLDDLPTERAIDYSEKTAVEPADVPVESLLTDLDAVLRTEIPALVVQARVARARVAAFVGRCPANAQVGDMAREVLESDLATLAAEGHLTPDLAFVWGSAQLSRYSAAAARPFVLQARDGGFDDPAVTYLLAIIALDLRQLDEADRLARDVAAIYEKAGDRSQHAQALFVRGEVAEARAQRPQARGHYQAALRIQPDHVGSLLGLARIERDERGESEAVALLGRSLAILLLQGPLDADKAKAVAQNLESLVTEVEEPHLQSLCRDALITEIDGEADAMRRGLRYFFAATLDVRLREYEVAHGHGVLAKEEFATAGFAPPVDVEEFLRHLEDAG